MEWKQKGHLQYGVSNFGDPRAPMPLSDASVSLLWSGHGREKKRIVFQKVFVKVLWVIESCCGTKWGRRGGRRGWVFVVGLVLCVALFLNNLQQFKQSVGPTRGILRFCFLFLYLLAITWLYCSLQVMIIELVFHKTIHMSFSLWCVLLSQNICPLGAELYIC